jgi:hypothetical protein
VLASKSGYNMQVAVVGLGSLVMYIELACMADRSMGGTATKSILIFLVWDEVRCWLMSGSQRFDSTI